MSIYVIPPYLLNTTLGESLQREVSTKCPHLALSNTISVKSPHYEATTTSPPLPQFKFSSDPIIHRIIRDKLVCKLGIYGVLGINVKKPDEFSDEELFELFETFKHRLLKDESSPKTDEVNGDSLVKKTPFEIDKYAEVLVDDRSGEVPERYHKYASYTLKQLLFMAKVESKTSSNTRPSFVKFDSEYFQYPLPSSWVSLITNANLNTLNAMFHFASGNLSGYPTIEVTTRRNESNIPIDVAPTRYCNYISDKPVSPSSGVFYYEVEVIQTCTEATDFQPLLAINDSSISTHKSPQCCVGFTKRYINYEIRRGSTPPASAITGNTTKLDLEDIKKDILLNQDNLINRPITGSVETLLEAKPGELRGSFALDLSDSNFYNSIRGSESAQRTSILNMNRRLSSLNRQNLEELDSGKINMDVPFATSITSENKTSKVVKSDIIGCGINFIDSSLFITLNGVFIRSIKKEELMANNPLNDNLFANNNLAENAVYPIIGFKMNKLEILDSKTPSSLVIQTNFGFKDFKFNIVSYVGGLKNESEKSLNLSLLDQMKQVKHNKIPDSTIEDSLLNVHDDSKLLNSFIRGYLNSEGCIDTLEAMNRDLADLNDTFQGSQENIDDAIIVRSHGKTRQAIKNYFADNKYDDVLSLIQKSFAEAFDNAEGKDLFFEIQLQKLTFLLKSYLERKLNLENYEFSFEYDNTEENIRAIHHKALLYATKLQHEYKHSQAKSARIRNVSALLLVKDLEALKNLPTANAEINQLEDNSRGLFERVNKVILRSLGFNEVSNLERIISIVDSNIQDLSLKHFDKKFALVNFERDQLEL